MFIVKKALAPFLLPPGIFILSLIVCGVWLLFKKRKAGIANIIIGYLIWVFSTSPVHNALYRGLESSFSVPRNIEGDVIVLLGGGVYDKVADLSGIGAPSEEMFGRIVTAVRLQKRLNVPIIVSSGKVFEHTSAGAPIVKRFLFELGVPADDIIIEDRSRDTFENATYTREICSSSGFKKPIGVTSASHLKRSVMIFEKVGLEVLPVPALFRSWQERQYGWADYLPGTLKHAENAIHEYLGLVFYGFAY
jgi:uncharacterized SAM-binding protein YcdF (DUF218 family)